MICQTDDQKKIWSVIETCIEIMPKDGIGAEGVYSEIVAEHQRAFVAGLRTARLAAINAIGHCR